MQADGILMEATETNFDQVDKKKKNRMSIKQNWPGLWNLRKAEPL